MDGLMIDAAASKGKFNKFTINGIVFQIQDA